MRLNRKWLYLGGLVTILTLLLTLTWVLPAGAVGQLDRGSLSTDDGYVSPDPDVEDGDMIEVTLANSELDLYSTVEDGGDIDPVVISFTGDIDAATHSLIRINLETGAGLPNVVRRALPADRSSDDVLPIAGNLSIDFDVSSSVDEGDVGTPVIVNPAIGLIEIPILADLTSSEIISLSYETSPQETALLNVSGDSGNFDVLAVESAAGPAGDYSATVVAAQEVVLDIGSDIVDEQHAVPSGLQGYVEFEDEEILTDRYSNWSANGGFTNEVDAELSAGNSFYVQVAHPPIRDMDGDGTVDLNDVDSEEGNLAVAAVSDATQGIIQLTVDTNSVLRLTDEVTVTYIGSDSFYIEVDHGPIQNMQNVAMVVPIVDTDDSHLPVDKLQIISIGNGVDTTCQDCRVRLGVMTGPMDDDEAEPLDPRISVLGISYEGSERISLEDGLGNGDTFTAELDFQPVNPDAGDDSIIDDIRVVGRSGLNANPSVTDVDGRIVQFTLSNNSFSGTDESDSATIDVAYSLRVGSNPQNALRPGETPRPIIAVAAGSRVAFTSDNDRATVDAETAGPAFANPSPSHNGATDDDAQVISVDVTDELAGVDQDSIELRVSVGGGASLTVSNEDLDFSEVTGGYRASIALDDIDDVPNIRASETTAVEWYAMANDNAGNSSRSDSDGDTDDDQNFTFNVDGEDPVILRVYTGDWFDSAAETVKGDRRIGVDDYLPGASNNGSIRVVFDERVDGATISADDFSVDGAAPTSAEWYGEGDSGDDSHIAQSVFLAVPAMAADSTPAVRIVGSVSDVAGNTTDSGTKTADDGIAPTATLSVDQALSKEKVTVTIQTDERIRTLSPELSLFISNGPEMGDESDTFTVENEDPDDPDTPLVLRDADGNALHSSGEIEDGDELVLRLSKAPILDSNGDGEVNHNDVEVTTGLVTEVNDGVNAKTGEVRVTVSGRDLAAGDEITVNYSGTDADPAKGLPGVPNPSGKQVSSTEWTFALSVGRNDRYAATVTAEDSARNRRTSGTGDPTADSATVFEIDDMLAGGESAETIPQHDAAGNLPVSVTNPFYIELSWDAEAEEYPGDSSSAVTLTKAELDGTDVLDTAAAQNDRSYRLSILDIGLGDHVLSYNAEDALGNTNAVDRVLRFTVQAVPTWDLSLSAGMNLISLPADPADTSVNGLFGEVEQVELIFTFEGSQSKVALRNADSPGEFVGTLDTIDSQHAYWVSSSNATEVEINIPPTSQLAPPPYIAAQGGQWNLLPVISLEPVDGGAAPGTEIDADSYLGDFRTAFGWNGRSWSKIDPDPAGDDRLTTGSKVKVGMGYWVLYDEDTIITP